MRILGINLSLVTQRPSAVAVNQRRLLHYSFPVYSRRQVRDLCDECPGCLGGVVTREGGRKEGEEEASEGQYWRCGGAGGGKLPIRQTQVLGKVWGGFCFSCF